MNNENNVEITYSTFDPIIVKRKTNINIDEFVNEIYSKLEEQKIITSAETQIKNFDGFLICDSEGQREMKAIEIYSNSKNPSLRELGLDQYDYLTILNSEPADFVEESGNSLQDLSEAKLVKSGFSKLAPDYRRINLGLTAEGKCTNNDCVANGKCVLNTIKNKKSGYGTFDIIVDRKDFVCPKCYSKIYKFTNFYFYLCKYSWTGLFFNQDTGKAETKSIKGVANSNLGAMGFQQFKNENNKDFIEYKFEIEKL